jgi:Tol biopolymer transport system component
VVARVATGAVAIATLIGAPAANAAFPGRDGLIAFTRWVGSKSAQIHVVRADGSSHRQITHGPRSSGEPSWSPDGRRIAFSTYIRRTSTQQIFVKRLGGGIKRITRRRDAYYRDPGWSPDGRRIVAARSVPGRDQYPVYSIVVMRADGGGERVVYDPGSRLVGAPAWSPDGRTIVFEQLDEDLRGADYNLYVVPAAGGTPRAITSLGWERNADWSPDGGLIAHAWVAPGGLDDIRLIRPDGTEEVRVTHDLATEDAPVWAPSGRRLAVGRLGRIWTMAPDGSDARPVTGGSEKVSDGQPSWQPR